MHPSLPTPLFSILSSLLVGSLFAASAIACGPSAGSQTNWLRACESDSQCGDLQCICGACTAPCEADATCSDLPGSACVSADDVGATALCGGYPPSSAGLCLMRCQQEEDCPQGSVCTAGVCSPLTSPTAEVLVDASIRYQSLVGFGASFGYAVDEVAQHSSREGVYDALFTEANLDLIRVRNGFGDEEPDFTGISGIVSAAADRLGSRPTVLLNSASPPGALKANGTSRCEGDPETCTLSTLAAGGFDYEGLAAYWRASIDAYTSAGVAPDYINIQNNPNWMAEADAHEACRFLPIEGDTTVTVDETEVEVRYPGLAEALTAVAGQLEGLSSAPGIIAPETTGHHGVIEYMPHLDLSNIAAIGHHLYGADAAAIDSDAFAELGAFGQQSGRPIFQTEMQADGFDTAVLLHHTLAVIGASAYLQNDFVVTPAFSPNPAALVAIEENGFSVQDPYHALRHYAFFTDRGWARVAATSDDGSLLASAWLEPAESALTVILVNAAVAEQVVRLDLGAFAASTASVVRTVFDGVERSTELGVLPSSSAVRVPGRAIVTVAARQ